MVSLNRLVPDNPATAVGVATTITLALIMVKTFCLGWTCLGWTCLGG